MTEKKENSNYSAIVQSWVNEHSDYLYSWAYYHISDKEAAEDLVQDTFLAAYKGIEKFEGRSQPRTWLLGILKNKLVDYYRAKYRRNNEVELPESARNPGNPFLNGFFEIDGDEYRNDREFPYWDTEQGHMLDDRFFRTVFQECFKKLPPKWQAVIHLKYIAQKDSEFICQELKISPANFWQILHRAKLQLRKCLEKHWFK